MPVNPINDIDIIDAEIKAIGNPLKEFGISENSNLSLIEENKISIIINPKEDPNVYIKFSIKL